MSCVCTKNASRLFYCQYIRKIELSICCLFFVKSKNENLRNTYDFVIEVASKFVLILLSAIHTEKRFIL